MPIIRMSQHCGGMFSTSNSFPGILYRSQETKCSSSPVSTTEHKFWYIRLIHWSLKFYLGRNSLIQCNRPRKENRLDRKLGYVLSIGRLTRFGNRGPAGPRPRSLAGLAHRFKRCGLKEKKKINLNSFWFISTLKNGFAFYLTNKIFFQFLNFCIKKYRISFKEEFYDIVSFLF